MHENIIAGESCHAVLIQGMHASKRLQVKINTNF